MNDPANVILVTFDSLSAKNMSLYGYGRNTTPFLDSFAGESLVFDRMHANSNCTVPSLASIMTGRYPLKHGYDRFVSLLGNGRRCGDLDDVLKSRGYKTAAVIGLHAGYMWVDSLGEATRGWMGDLMAGRLAGRSISGVSTSLEATLRKTLEMLDCACEPFFLWIHLYPPHQPYLASRSFGGTFVKEKVFDVIRRQRPYFNRFYPEVEQHAVDMLRDRYDEHILETDHTFGGFVGSLRERGLLDTSMVIVTSDHGEMFEKGYQGHRGPLLYDPLVHVPFIVRLPNGPAGRRIGTSAEQVDIAPTVLDLLGMDIPRHMDGESLAGAMFGGCGSARPKFSVSTISRIAGRDSLGRSISVVFNGHKLILDLTSGACELYDLVRDPGENANIAACEPDRGRELKEMISDRFAGSAAYVPGLA
jgi:arylsulfatase A-like enzyme